jgi:hypothetical protein
MRTYSPLLLSLYMLAVRFQEFAMLFFSKNLSSQGAR